MLIDICGHEFAKSGQEQTQSLMGAEGPPAREVGVLLAGPRRRAAKWLELLVI